MDLRGLPPVVRLDLGTRFQLDRGMQAVERGFVFGQYLVCRAKRCQDLGALLPIRARVAEAPQSVFVVVDSLAVEVQDSRTVAGGAQIAHRAFSIVAAAEMQRQQCEAIGDSSVAPAFERLAGSAVQSTPGRRQQAGIHRFLNQRVAEVPEPGRATAVTASARLTHECALLLEPGQDRAPFASAEHTAQQRGWERVSENSRDVDHPTGGWWQHLGQAREASDIREEDGYGAEVALEHLRQPGHSVLLSAGPPAGIRSSVERGYVPVHVVPVDVVPVHMVPVDVQPVFQRSRLHIAQQPQ
jgi:hypothetical protein